MQQDVIIKNGRIVDPANNFDAIGNLCIHNGRIVAEEFFQPAENTLVVDASGCVVTPGLIDKHAHVFHLDGQLGAPADSFLVDGVTTLVDAGSAGVDSFALFNELVLKRARVNVYAMLNVSAAGLATESWHENLDPRLFSGAKVKDWLAACPGKITALKIRTSREIVGSLGYAPLDAALKLADEVGLPLVVHTPNPPGDAADLIDRLRPGDVYAHAFNPYGSNILDDSGRVKPAFHRAKRRGVVIDSSGAKRFYTFPILKAAMEQGFAPDVISSDITAFNQWDPFTHNMPYCMTCFMALGMSLPEVVRAATSTPGNVMSLKGHGDLSIGSVADVAVFREEENPILVKDYMGNSTRITKWLVPQMTVLRGKVAFRQLCFRS